MSTQNTSPLVGIIMGSDSDLPEMIETAKVLKEFSIPFEIKVLSAHRTPDAAAEYAKTAMNRGLRIIIAGAGGAAHLAGVIAASTTLPVIGVPIPSKHLQGLDSLLSTVQMPSGIPVATVAIGGAYNAGVLAVSILALTNSELQDKYKKFKQDLTEKVKKKNDSLQQKVQELLNK